MDMIQTARLIRYSLVFPSFTSASRPYRMSGNRTRQSSHITFQLNAAI